jgi:type III secretion protein J
MRAMARSIFLTLIWLVFTVVSCTTNTTIVYNIPEREANEMVVLLNSKNIPAVKITAAAPTTGGGGTAEQMWNIAVPGSQITEALAVLNHAGLPRLKGTTLLDLFGTQGLVPSDIQDKIRFQEGLSEQLATTIRKMDGIIDANVQITFPSEQLPAQKITASIYVKHRGILDNPNSLAIIKIKRLVSSAVPGLTTENVSVITDRALTSDITPQTVQQLEEERQYVSVWSVAVAKDSVNRFRLIFYTFIIIIFLLACALAWLIWKFLPLIQRKGGFVFLLHSEQYKGVFPLEEEKRQEE